MPLFTPSAVSGVVNWWHFPPSQEDCEANIPSSSYHTPYSHPFLTHRLRLVPHNFSSAISVRRFIEHFLCSRKPLAISVLSSPSQPKPSTTLWASMANDSTKTTPATRVSPNFSNCSNAPPILPQKPRPWLFSTSRASRWIEKRCFWRFGSWGKIGNRRFWLSNGVRSGAVATKRLVVWWYGFWGVTKSSVLLGVWYETCIGLWWIRGVQCLLWLIGMLVLCFWFFNFWLNVGYGLNWNYIRCLKRGFI